VILVVMLALVLPMVASAAGGQVPEREVDQARRVAQDWVNSAAVIDPVCFAQWEGAHLTSPQGYYNPRGELIAYMFAIEKNGETVGHVLVGTSAYGFTVFMAGPGRPFPVPPAHEVSRTLEKEHGLQIAPQTIGEPRLVLLSLLRGFYATWELEGQVVGINLIMGHSFTRPNLELIESAFPSPVDFMAATTATRQSLSQPLVGLHRIREWWHMDAFQPTPGHHPPGHQYWCGPASGVSIGQWKRQADGDVGLHTCNSTMWAYLYDFMSTGFLIPGVTWPSLYGPGFVDYGASRGEVFNYARHPNAPFSVIIGAIAADHPLAFCGWVYLPGKGWAYHWWGIEGWRIDANNNHFIHITCNAIPTDGLCVNWAAVTGIMAHWVIEISDTDN